MVPWRYVTAVVCTFTNFCLFASRVSIAVTINSMVNSTRNHHNLDPDTECHYPVQYHNGSNDSIPITTTVTHGTFNWSESVQGLILSAFYYGYVLTQVPGGWIASKFGGKRPLIASLLATIVLNFILPSCAYLGWYFVVIILVLLGIAQGGSIPALYTIIAYWSPPKERSTMTSMIWTSATLGSLISLPVSGFLCEYGFAGGWPSVFYFLGILSSIALIFLCLLCTDRPSDNRWISENEIRLIGKIENTKTTKDAIPWRAILSSVPVWALIITYFCNTWGVYTFMTCIPLYMNQILRFDIKSNGALSAVPYVLNMIMISLSGLVADCLLRRGLRTSTVRKLMNTIGMVSAGAFVLGVSFAGCRRLYAVVAFTLTVGLGAISTSGNCANHFDLSPQYSGVIMSIANTLGTVAGMISPLLVGVLTDGNPTIQQWRYVLYIASSFYGVGALVFLFFSKSEEQPWSKTQKTPENTEELLEKITEKI